MSYEWMENDRDLVKDLAAENARLQAEVARLEAEVADLKTRIRTAVRVLLSFAGRLGVEDDDLAGILAEAQMRTEGDAHAD